MALAAFRRGFLASMLFLCLLLGSAAAGPCRDLVDLNARAARGAAFDELEFNQCISTEASRSVCEVFVYVPDVTWRTIPAAFPPTRAVSLSVEPAPKKVICLRRLPLLLSLSEISWREYRRAF